MCVCVYVYVYVFVCTISPVHVYRVIKQSLCYILKTTVGYSKEVNGNNVCNFMQNYM
jgi:hypothetical protein